MHVYSLYTPDELKSLGASEDSNSDSLYNVCVLGSKTGPTVHIFQIKDCLDCMNDMQVYASTHIPPEYLNNYRFPVEVSSYALTVQDILNSHLIFDSSVSINLVRTVIWRAMLKTTDRATQSYMAECRLIEPESDEPWFSQLSFLEKLGIQFHKESEDEDLVPPSYWESLWSFRHKISKMLLRM